MPTAREIFPEYELVPTTYCNVPIFRFRFRFDYVQNLERNNKADSFHILCKKYRNGAYKFGVLFLRTSCLRTICAVAIPAAYDKVIILGDTKGSRIYTIIELGNKYGLYIWEHGFFINHKHVVPTVYDSFSYEPNKEQFKAVRGNVIDYYDMTGNLLK